VRCRESRDCATFFSSGFSTDRRYGAVRYKIDGILDSGSVPGSINVPASWCGFELCDCCYNKT